jgi:hypothetical protein
MRFLLAVIDHEGNRGTPNEMAAIDVFNDSLERTGQLLMACGIAGPSTATVIDNRDGAGLVTSGPVNDVREYMSGFWLIEASDREQALALATLGSLACNRKVEVRALLTLDDE